MLEYTPLITQGNCVTAAQQTLTLYVGVRIPIPLPERSTAKAVLFFRSGRGIEDSHHSAEGAGFAYPDRRSKSSLFRRREWVSSPKANTPIPRPNFPTNALQSPRFYDILIT